MSKDNDSFEARVDKSILDFLSHDFRRTPTFTSKALQLSSWTKYCEENPNVLQVEEYARSILDYKNGVSVRTMVRLLNKFSNANLATQKLVLGNLLTNDKHVRVNVKFKILGDKLGDKSNDKFELDIDGTELFLVDKLTIIDSKSVDSACYN